MIRPQWTVSEMDSAQRPRVDVRVERGSPGDAEIAAVVTALLAVRRPEQPAEPDGARRAAWVRPQQFQAPGSWTRFGRERPVFHHHG